MRKNYKECLDKILEFLFENLETFYSFGLRKNFEKENSFLMDVTVVRLFLLQNWSTFYVKWLKEFLFAFSNHLISKGRYIYIGYDTLCKS